MTRGERIAWIWVWSVLALLPVALIIALSLYRNLPLAYFDAFLCDRHNGVIATSACTRLAADEEAPVRLRSIALRRLVELHGNAPEVAIARLSELIQLGTANAEDWNLRGINFYWQHDYVRAAHDFEQAASLNSAVGMYWANLADAQIEMKNFDAAARNYSTAMERNYDTAEVRGNRGWAFHQLGIEANALADYDWAIERDPESADNFNERGLVRHAIDDYHGALANFNRSLSLAPDDPVILVNRAITYARIGNLEKAKQDLDQAATVDRDLFDDAAAVSHSSPSMKRAYGSFKTKINQVPRRTTRCDCRPDKVPVISQQGPLAWPGCLACRQ